MRTNTHPLPALQMNEEQLYGSECDDAGMCNLPRRPEGTYFDVGHLLPNNGKGHDDRDCGWNLFAQEQAQNRYLKKRLVPCEMARAAGRTGVSYCEAGSMGSGVGATGDPAVPKVLQSAKGGLQNLDSVSSNMDSVTSTLTRVSDSYTRMNSTVAIFYPGGLDGFLHNSQAYIILAITSFFAYCVSLCGQMRAGISACCSPMLSRIDAFNKFTRLDYSWWFYLCFLLFISFDVSRKAVQPGNDPPPPFFPDQLVGTFVLSFIFWGAQKIACYYLFCSCCTSKAAKPPATDHAATSREPSKEHSPPRRRGKKE